MLLRQENPTYAYWRGRSLHRGVVLKWFYSPRAVGTPLSEVRALYRVPSSFYRASAYSRAILTVCLSVRNVPVLDENGLTYCDSFFSPYSSPIILVLSASAPSGGDKYRWGIKISRFFTNKSLYLANDTRYRHSYYGRRIGTRMRSIKWCHSQWPWTNPDLFSRSHHPLMLNISQTATDTAIVTRRRIGNRTQAFEWHHFQWPWEAKLQGHGIIQRQITRKWCHL